MTALTIPLILVALGSTALAFLRGRPAIAALAIQWLGLAMAAMYADGSLRLGRGSSVELVTALICVLIAWLSLGSSSSMGAGARVARSRPRDYVAPVAGVLVGGLAGVGLTLYLPLSDAPELDLIFYWTVLSGIGSLAFEGTRYAVKMAIGLFSPINSIALLLLWFGVTPPDTGMLALLSAARIGLAVAVAYGWLWLAATFGDLGLDHIFGARDTGERALAVVGNGFAAGGTGPEGAPELRSPDGQEDVEEVEETQEEEQAEEAGESEEGEEAAEQMQGAT